MALVLTQLSWYIRVTFFILSRLNLELGRKRFDKTLGAFAKPQRGILSFDVSSRMEQRLLHWADFLDSILQKSAKKMKILLKI
jgi:hypothetical protein